MEHNKKFYHNTNKKGRAYLTLPKSFYIEVGVVVSLLFSVP